MDEVDGLQDAQRWCVQVVAQVIIHNGVFVDEMVCRVSQGNDTHMTTLHNCSFADSSRRWAGEHTVFDLKGLEAAFTIAKEHRFSKSEGFLANTARQECGHPLPVEHSAHLGQTLTDVQLLHKRMREGCQSAVLWYISTHDSHFARSLLYVIQRLAARTIASSSLAWSRQGQQSFAVMPCHSLKGLGLACTITMKGNMEE